MAMKVYKGTDGMTEPLEQECETFGWPNRTTDGEPMYDNTHFATMKEAWDSIRRSVWAGVRLAGDEMLRAREILAKAERGAGRAAADFAEADSKYRDWERNQEARAS